MYFSSKQIIHSNEINFESERTAYFGISKSMNRHSKWEWIKLISEIWRSPAHVFENVCKQMPLGIFKTTYRSPCIHWFLWKQAPDYQCSFENLITPLLQIWSPSIWLIATRNFQEASNSLSVVNTNIMLIYVLINDAIW